MGVEKSFGFIASLKVIPVITCSFAVKPAAIWGQKKLEAAER